ncbi:hypothetical protein [Fibrella aquatica]|uniref:hypothetical protein n=1 Tax=Fibrella aquatica TaxID=3242487 RepID=UPI003522443B
MHFISKLFLLGLLAHQAVGQSVGSDSAVLASTTRQAVVRYEQVSHTLEQLYNGPEYIGYDRQMEGHAFFQTDSLLSGRVTYQGGEFTVPMLFDIVKDLLVVVHPTGYRMALHSNRIQRFTIDKQPFIRLDSLQQNMPSGFYNLVYDGPSQVLVRRVKLIVAAPSTTSPWNAGMFGSFDPKTTYFIRRNGTYVQVKNKRALYTLFADRRKELMAYARQQQIRFKPSPEAAFLKLTQHYDQLTKAL